MTVPDKARHVAGFGLRDSLLRGSYGAQGVTFQTREAGTEIPDDPWVWKL